MFSKLALFAVATMAVLVAAAPTPSIENSCNTGPAQCCNSMHSAESHEGNALLALVGVAVGSVTGQIGATCSPITAIGLGGGASCTQQPVCCSDNSFNGLIAIGCSPVNINA
ncbi:hydrophobin [Crassisporium funariophilum]|nr:hydrophobin [Crassisporium funariophilum]